MYKGKTIACVIPARMSSGRFPGKPLAKIAGRELVLRVADIASKCKYFDNIIVATEDKVIQDLCLANAYDSVITNTHYTCTHRVAEVADKYLSEDYVFNLQGDEPQTKPEDLDTVIEFGIDNDCDVVQPYRDLVQEDIDDEDCVQMTVSNGNITHLQRVPDTITDGLITQIGMYFYKRDVIIDFPQCDQTWVKYWKGLDTLGFCGKYKVTPCRLDTKTRAIDRPHHIQEVEPTVKRYTWWDKLKSYL